MIRLNLVLFLNICLLSIGLCQGPDALFSFDGCDGSDAIGNYPDASIGGSPSCECGLTANSFRLDGSNDAVIMDPSTMDILRNGDFTLGFYFFIEDKSSTKDIFSVRSACNLDSFMAVRYLPGSDEIIFDIAGGINSLFSVRVPLGSEDCWHSIDIVKFGLEYSFYYDSQLIETDLAEQNIPFSLAASPAFANSPCLASSDDRFVGRIDEFTMYDRALSRQEILSKYLYPDQIINRDTTIFAGGNVFLDAGNSCASNFTWTPTTGLDDPFILDPIASPTESTTYTISLDNGSCSTMDTIRINVIDPNALDCENLLLPKAFTPNGDGLNDIYRISNQFIIESLEFFEIYDRWGSKVFVTSDFNAGWDGMFNGQKVNPGMYLYKIKYSCQGEERLVVNNFSVLR